MRDKGRQVRGEEQGLSKLTENQVLEMRRRFVPYGRENGAAALAKEFGISDTHVYRVIHGYAWKHTVEDFK